MDIMTLALAKAFTEKTVDGLGALKGANAVITSITKENGISTVTFEWTGTSGTKETDSIQVKDGEKGDTGLSVKSLSIDENEHLIITYSDNSTEDAGAMPRIELGISAEGGNALIQKEDGLYVAEGAVVISPDENNALESRENGLYAENKDLSNYVQIYNEEGNPGWTQNEVDSELSKTSEKPVQNKVITAELEKIKSITANNNYEALNNKTSIEGVHKVYSMEVGNSAIDPVIINDFKIDPTYRYLYIINGSGTTDYEVGILMFINGMKFIPLSSSSSQTTIKDNVSAIGIHIYIENGELKVSRDEISNSATCVIYKLG